ncbi:metallophosphoesterase [Methylobacterium sp. AMS5]|uniref:metallophosphoesterase n=1 Tax=Methylobacterium sp. AMS5 TaxID=925818 RepID=UPI00074F964C|nr:metallophosphoesterase [Methylobacterium sp. AMS5]AMB48361.1 hypothetical protein Y590_25670 [Methylobacterium sp. AMS5]
MVYALFSDQHAHNWSAYSTKLPSGLNSRLDHMLTELKRGAQELRAAGGDTIVFAGDLFHSRGSIDPEVFNPVSETIKGLTWDGFNIVAIPGNHDLKSNETTVLGNAIQSLSSLKGFTVITEPMHLASLGLAMVPWIPKLDDLKAALEALASTIKVPGKGFDCSETDLVIHAGIDGVLSGVPGHGLTPSYLAGLGFRRVFAGHYHHHCAFEAGKVWSIGATTHQTFSDIGTKAGFLLVDDKRVNYRASRAPSFVEVTPDTPSEEIPLIVADNHVRVRGFAFDDAETNAFRRGLEGMGAAGITFQVERKVASARTGTTAAKGVTLETSVNGFIKRMGSPHEAAIAARAAQIITDARAATE